LNEAQELYVEALRAYPEQVDVLNNVSHGGCGREGGKERGEGVGLGRLLTNETIKAKSLYTTIAQTGHA